MMAPRDLGWTPSFSAQYLALCKLFNLTEPLFPHMENGPNNGCCENQTEQCMLKKKSI